MGLVAYGQNNWTSYYISLPADSLSGDSVMLVIQTDYNQGVVFLTSLDTALFTSPEIFTSLVFGSADISEAELEILDGATVTTAELNVLDAADTDLTTLDLPASTTISAYGATLTDDADAATALATLGITATASEINTPLDGASVTLTEFQELETIGATTISANQWAALGSLAETVTGTELSYVDGITSNVVEDNDFASGNSLVWLLSDTITLGTTGFVDSCNTDWVYPILEMNTASDSIYATGLVARCLGTNVDVTFSVYADSTLNDATPSDTLYSAWQLTDESGAAVVQSSLTDSIISLDKVIWMEFTTVTTEPTSFMLSVMGRRYNRTY